MNAREKQDLDNYITRSEHPFQKRVPPEDDEPLCINEDGEEILEDEEVLCTPSAADACINAKGKDCNCACGGVNHGRNVQVRQVGRHTIRRLS